MGKFERWLCNLITISILITIVVSVLNFTSKAKIEKSQQSGWVSNVNLENTEKTINDVDWKSIDDNELDTAISNTSEEEMATFLGSLNQEETDLLLSKKTALITPRIVGTPTGETYVDENGEELPKIDFETTHEMYFDYLTQVRATSNAGTFDASEADDGHSRWLEKHTESTLASGGFKVRIVKMNKDTGSWNKENGDVGITMIFRFKGISREVQDITTNSDDWTVEIIGDGNTSADYDGGYDDYGIYGNVGIKIKKVAIERNYSLARWEGPVVYLSYSKPEHYYPIWNIETCIIGGKSLWGYMDGAEMYRKIFTS